jgi:hypothetical protein
MHLLHWHSYRSMTQGKCRWNQAPCKSARRQYLMLRSVCVRLCTLQQRFTMCCCLLPYVSLPLQPCSFQTLLTALSGQNFSGLTCRVTCFRTILFLVVSPWSCPHLNRNALSLPPSQTPSSLHHVLFRSRLDLLLFSFS